MKYFTVGIIMLTLCSCSASRIVSGTHFTPISPYALLGNGLNYDGKQVYVVGVICFGFEDYALYSDQNAFNGRVNANSFYLNFDTDESKKIDYVNVKNLHGKSAVIGGVYRYGQFGHGALNTGGKIEINYVKEWE